MSTIIFPAAEVQRPRLFSMRGRIGRARYVAFSLGAVVVLAFAMMLVGMFLMHAGSFGRLLYQLLSVAVFYGLLPLLFVMLTIRRAHDFNTGGWIALLLLVPLVNLLFWVVPGTRGENRHGPQPEEASAGMKAVAVILPALLIGGFLFSDDKPLAPPRPNPIFDQDTRPAQEQPAPSTSTLQPYRP